MARYTGPREKIERRIGEKLFLKGERSYGPKSAVVRKPYPPGPHTKRFGGRPSEFSMQLKSKQKVKNIYRLLEKQFKSSVQSSLLNNKEPYNAISQNLETRLDNVTYRTGFAQSRDQARQIVNHGHILVNGRKVGIPSYHVKSGDVLSIREGSKVMPYFANLMPQWFKVYEGPTWLKIDKEKLQSTVERYPTLEDSGLKPDDIQAIIEFYSR